MKNKQRKSNAVLALIMTMILTVGALTGCSSSGEKKETPFQLVVCNDYMDNDPIVEYGEQLKSELPSLTADGKEPIFAGMSMGNSEKDAMGTVGGMMKFSSMIAAKEIDVVIMDLENAPKHARGESFLDITTIFTEEELAGVQDRLISFDMVDSEGNPTDEKTPVCGVDISGYEPLKDLMAGRSFGIFIVGNSPNLEQAKEVFLHIIGS